ncbi:hypothetical protein FRC02_011782 [Tulasnella sp. 418]|nr:hypothetical protein FRC02_011782 [Tulasnella sp. 418]
MSLSQDSLSKGNDRKAFVTALVTNSAALVIQVAAFSWLKGRLQRVYAPRSFLPPPEKRSEAIPPGPWKWFPALLTSPSTDIIPRNGLDAYLFIRFLRLLMMIFGVFTLFTWPVLLPVDAVGFESNRDGLSKLSWGNVPVTQQTRYAAHLVLAYLLTFFVLWLIRRELDHFVKSRHQFLISHSHAKLAQSKTVLITSVPHDMDEKQLGTLLSFVPGGIAKIWIYRDNGDLPDLHEQRLEACQKLEKAECKLLRDALKAKRAEDKIRKAAEKKAKKARSTEPVDRSEAPLGNTSAISTDVEKGVENAFAKVVRPTHRLGKIPFFGQKVDTITWCKEEIARLSHLIDERRAQVGERKSQGSAFVQCNLQIGAHILSQVVTYHEPLAMYEKWTDVAPEDVVWSNIDDGAYETRARYVISWAATIGLIVLWSFPVAFVGLLSNVDSLCSEVHWLAWVCRLPSVVQGIIQGVLPPLFLAILFLILPMILRGLAWYQCIPRYSLISLSVYKRYFLFLIIHGFLIVTLSSGLTAAIPQILQNPGSIVESLAQRMPDASIFFLTYVTVTGMAGAAAALLQLVPLVLYFVHRWLVGDTPRSAYGKTFVMPKADFGTILPRISLVAAIGLAYSIISPVINGLALLSFFLLWLAWKFLFTWVFDQPDAQETGGLYFPLAISNLFVGLYIEQICLAGLFFLATDEHGNRSSLPQGILTVVLLAITFAAQILLRKSYGPITEHLPVSVMNKKLAERYERKHKGEESKGVLPDLFRRDNVRSVVRRRLKIRPKSVEDPEKLKKEQFEREQELSKGKQVAAQHNFGDLQLLDAVLRAGFVDSRPTSSAIAQYMTMEPPHSPTSPTTSQDNETTMSHTSAAPLRRRESAGSTKSKGSGKMRFAPPAPALRVEQPDDDDGDSSDDDNEDHAFDHPSTYVDAPWIWIPKDDLGLSTYLVTELIESGVQASDIGAFIDKKGNVEVVRNPPDEEWSGGHDH